MTIATAPAPALGAASPPHTIRLALVAVLVVVLLAAAFVVGRATATTTSHAPTAPAATPVRPAPQHCGIPGIPC
jgi:hypothetical protein